jgi:hypothetical protein
LRRFGALRLDGELARPVHIFHRFDMLLIMRIIRTCCNCTRSPVIRGRFSDRSVGIEMEYRAASLRNNSIIPRITSFTSTGSLCEVPFLKSQRIRLMISVAREASTDHS